MKYLGCTVLVALAMMVGAGGRALCAESADAEAKAIEADNQDADVKSCIFAAFNHIAHTKAEETIAACSKVVNDAKHSAYFRASSYRRIGDALTDQGKNNEALDYLAKSIDLDPKDDTIFGDRGDLYRTMGQLEKALDDYKRAVALSKSDLDLALAFRGMALVYNIQEQYDLAIAYQTKTIELVPESAKSAAYKNRGIMWSNKGDSARAQADYAKAIDLEAQRK
jgi:tetratricopeptide (TPR) repeat protein